MITELKKLFTKENNKKVWQLSLQTISKPLNLRLWEYANFVTYSLSLITLTKGVRMRLSFVYELWLSPGWVFASKTLKQSLKYTLKVYS